MLEYLSYISPILILIITIVILVTLHEFGHYYVSIKLKYPVKEFSIGMGKLFYSKTDSKGTQWNIRMLPLGGFVDLDLEKVQPLHRSLIAFAGPFTSYLTGLIFIIISIYFYDSNIEKRLFPHSIFVENFEFHNEINQKNIKISNSYLISAPEYFIENYNKKINHSITIDIKKSSDDKFGFFNLNDNNTLYIDIKKENIRSVEFELRDNRSLIEDIKLSFIFTCDIVILIVKTVAYLIVSLWDDRPGSIISIAHHGNNHFNAGIAYYIYFLGVLSLNLAVMNIIPIAPLDGYHIIGGLSGHILKNSIDKLNFIKYIINIAKYIGILIFLKIFIMVFFNDLYKSFITGF